MIAVCLDGGGCRRLGPRLGHSCVAGTLADVLGQLLLGKEKDIYASMKWCDVLAEVPVSKL